MEAPTPLRTLCTHISQMLYCLTLLGIAAVEWRLHPDLGQPPWVGLSTSIVLAALTACLFVWNAVEGLRQLASQRHWVAFGLLAGIHISVTVLLVHAFPVLVMRR